MKTFKGFNLLFLLVLLTFHMGSGSAIASGAASTRAANTAQARSAPIIIDHTTTDITAVPQYWIEEAKRTLHIGYGHTSHGSQITSGMSGLVAFANGGGLGLALPDDIFQFDHYDNQGGAYLHLFEGDGYGDGDLDHDAGYYPNWVDETRAYLGNPDPTTGRGTDHLEMNVIMWSWCGQASGYTEQQMIDRYLAPMTQLEVDYPGITFVYMTGHADGSGEAGNLHQRNQQIRDYCIANDKVLFDFYDIELYDPDGNYYGDKAVNDNCDYDSDGNGSRDKNWALDWQGSHTEDVDWFSCGCAHSQSLNCNQKAYAIWWLWARLAGWEGNGSPPTVDLSPSTKSVSPLDVHVGDTVTYTVNVRNSTGPVDVTALMTDTLGPELDYVPGSLAATVGTVDDSQAPALYWSGTLSPTSDIAITYSAVVTPTIPGSTITLPATIINTANIAAVEYEGITRTATLLVEPEMPPTVDLSPSTKSVSTPSVSVGQTVTYTVNVRNSAGPVDVTALMTDTLGPELDYVPGSLSATSGTVNDSQAPILLWSGTLSPTSDIAITYSAVVTPTIPGSTIIMPATIINRANITAVGYQSITRTVTLQVGWYQIYLPLVLKMY